MTETLAVRPGGEDIPQPTLARRILLVVLCSYVFNGIINLRLDNPHQGQQFWWTLGCVLGVFVLQLTVISANAPGWPLWRKTATLGVQAVLTYLPFFAFHEVWGGMAGFLAGSFLLLVRRPLAWAYFSVIVASMYVFAAHNYHTANWISYYVVATMLLGLIVFGMTRLSQLVAELYEVREELARMAVTRERLRFARDLHDLLGYSLSSITLKTELTYRLVPKQPQRAKEELSGILEISRQALADVREVARAYRDMSLEAEAVSAKGMLAAAEIDTELRLEYGTLDPATDTVLATTLREGVTNMLRHSKAQRCVISVTQADAAVRLELGNDGVVAHSGGLVDASGSGLGNLRTRLVEIGGSLDARISEDLWFWLVAQAPRAAAGQPVDGGPARSTDLEDSGTAR